MQWKGREGVYEMQGVAVLAPIIPGTCQRTQEGGGERGYL